MSNKDGRDVVDVVTPSSGCVAFDLGIPCFGDPPCRLCAAARPAGGEVERVRAALARTETEGFTPEIEQILMDDLPAILDATTKGTDNDQ